jgi:hypothetical protein
MTQCDDDLNVCGQTFFWGRTKTSGEATMYPKPVYDLNGVCTRVLGASVFSEWLCFCEIELVVKVPICFWLCFIQGGTCVV